MRTAEPPPEPPSRHREVVAEPVEPNPDLESPPGRRKKDSKPVATKPAKKPKPPKPVSGSGFPFRSFITGIVAVLAIVAIGLSGWALLRPAAKPAALPTFSDAQRADAKTKTCAAIDLVRRGISRNTNLVVPGGEGDVAGSLAATANARISLYNGGQYLLSRVDLATASPLAETARGFANNLMDIGAAATAGVPDSDPAQAARLKDADAANATLGQLCT